MQMSPEMKLLLIGCAGGVIPDLIRFAKARYDANIADYFKHWNFWLGLLVLVVLGGLAVVFGEPTTITQALALGYAAPEFFSRMVAEQPAKPAMGDVTESPQLNPKSEEFSVRRWWSQ
jgi:hypothetical protein